MPVTTLSSAGWAASATTAARPAPPAKPAQDPAGPVRSTPLLPAQRGGGGGGEGSAGPGQRATDATKSEGLLSAELDGLDELYLHEDNLDSFLDSQDFDLSLTPPSDR